MIVLISITVMVRKMITDFEEATIKAVDFLKKTGYPFSKLISVSKKEGEWIVLLDTGVLKTERKKVIVDGITGRVKGVEEVEQK